MKGRKAFFSSYPNPCMICVKNKYSLLEAPPHPFSNTIPSSIMNDYKILTPPALRILVLILKLKDVQTTMKTKVAVKVLCLASCWRCLPASDAMDATDRRPPRRRPEKVCGLQLLKLGWGFMRKCKHISPLFQSILYTGPLPAIYRFYVHTEMFSRLRNHF